MGRQIYEPEDRKLCVYQEHVETQVGIGNTFYAFFKGEVSPACGYVVPKDGFLVMGVGVPADSLRVHLDPIAPLKRWLANEFEYREKRVKMREIWSIPYGFLRVGRGSVLLAGDAAGFCNPLSGEGVRWAIESGAAAGEAITTAMLDGSSPEEVYGGEIRQIQRTLGRIYDFMNSLSDETRETFVEKEIERVSLV